MTRPKRSAYPVFALVLLAPTSAWADGLALELRTTAAIGSRSEAAPGVALGLAHDLLPYLAFTAQLSLSGHSRNVSISGFSPVGAALIAGTAGTELATRIVAGPSATLRLTSLDVGLTALAGVRFDATLAGPCEGLGCPTRGALGTSGDQLTPLPIFGGELFLRATLRRGLALQLSFGAESTIPRLVSSPLDPEPVDRWEIRGGVGLVLRAPGEP